ncbi:hypothetical protein R1sor_014441 [Riccia sorocarpa]|uniref:Uncharacterized protein n=1 Tax=Riccia sorocarpa TaxID=122646 RepID=A0ABD3HBY8_9MARC
MYNNQDTLSRGLLTLSEWEIENCPWWVEQPCEDEDVKCVGDAEQFCWDKIQKEEDPFNVSHDRFESGEEDEVLTQAEFVEPSKNIDGLALDTSRTKKQKEARQSSKAKEEETGGSTPTGKAKEQAKPGSGRTRSAKKQPKEKAPKQLKKKRDEPAEAEPVLETPALEIEPNVPKVGTSTLIVEEQATGIDKSTNKEEARQRKRTKK